MSLTVSNNRITSLSFSEPERASNDNNIPQQESRFQSEAPSSSAVYSEAQTANFFAQTQKSILLAKTKPTESGQQIYNETTGSGNTPQNGSALVLEGREINGVMVYRSPLRWAILEAQGKADQLCLGDNLHTLLLGQYVKKYGAEAAKEIMKGLASD